MNKKDLAYAVYYLSEVYKVPYEVLAFSFQVSRATIKRLKKSFNGRDREEVIKEAKERIELWSLGIKEYQEAYS